MSPELTAKRVVVAAGVLLGALLVAVGGLVGLLVGDGRVDAPWLLLVGALVVVVAAVLALWKVRGRRDEDADRPVPWAEGSFATPPPERSREDPPLASEAVAARVRAAAEAARSEGTVEDGVADLRPELREALLSAMVAGGTDRAAAEAALAEGAWTDDPVAASALEPAIEPPERSLRWRLRAWLFPEQVTRAEIRRTVDAVARAAEEALPTVPGQTAPRPVPVRKPRLQELRRDAAGDLVGAADPEAVARGPDPPEPDPDSSEPEPGSPERDSDRGTVRDGSATTDRHRDPERGGAP